MRKLILIISLLFLIPLVGYTQPNANYNVDYGFKLGASNYLGDMGGYNKKEQPFIIDLKMQETRWSLGTYIRYRIGKSYGGNNPPWAIEAQLNWVRITGADTLTKNYEPRKQRALNFRNDIIQFNLMGEWIFFENNDVGHKHIHNKAINLYVCSGISIMYQDPYAYNPYHEFGLPTWVNLHGLRTEDKLYYKPFHLIQPGIPWGVGFNYTFRKQYRIGWSFTWTETFTDYLDGVSGTYPSQAQWNTLTPQEKYFSNRIGSLQGVDPAPDGLRGNSTGTDSFMTTTLNFGFLIRYPKRRHNRSTGGRFSRSKF